MRLSRKETSLPRWFRRRSRARATRLLLMALYPVAAASKKRGSLKLTCLPLSRSLLLTGAGVRVGMADPARAAGACSKATNTNQTSPADDHDEPPDGRGSRLGVDGKSEPAPAHYSRRNWWRRNSQTLKLANDAILITPIMAIDRQSGHL